MEEKQSFAEKGKLAHVYASGIRAVMNRAAELKREGKPVISFSAGEPDFDTPADIRHAASAAMENHMTHYSSARGELCLREEIAKKILRDTGVDYDPETEILVTSGGSEAIFNTMEALVNRGDEVIIPVPAFGNYKNSVILAGGTPVTVPLDPGRQFALDPDEIENRITDRTRMIVLNSPNNPTGAIYSRASMEAVAALARRYDLWIFSDEIYSSIVYEDMKFCSPASFPDMKERTIMMNGFSKAYAMTGWRLGYAACPKDIMEALLRVHQYLTCTSPTFLQIGAAEGMNTEHTLQQTEQMRSAFAQRRQMVLSELGTMRGISFVKPAGAFYIMADVEGLGMTGKEFSRRLLETKYTAVVPADAFGSWYKNWVRISYAASEENIREGMARIRALAAEYC